VAIQLIASKATHRAGEHQPGDGVYREQLLIATHELPLPFFTASDFVGPLQWATTAGGLSLSGARATLLPPNRTQLVTVTVTDVGTGVTVQRTVTVYSTFPLAPNWEFDVLLPLTKKKSEAEDRSAAFRGRGLPYPDGRGGAMPAGWRVEMVRREQFEAHLFESHLQFHDADLEFYFIDTGSGYEPRLVRYTAGGSRRVGGEQQHTITAQFEEIAPADSFLAA
jgi:hypothetical protein